MGDTHTDAWDLVSCCHCFGCTGIDSRIWLFVHEKNRWVYVFCHTHLQSLSECRASTVRKRDTPYPEISPTLCYSSAPWTRPSNSCNSERSWTPKRILDHTAFWKWTQAYRIIHINSTIAWLFDLDALSLSLCASTSHRRLWVPIRWAESSRVTYRRHRSDGVRSAHARLSCLSSSSFLKNCCRGEEWLLSKKIGRNSPDSGDALGTQS